MASCLCPCFLLIGIISCGLFFPASQSSVCLVMGVLVIPSELGHNKLKHMLSKTWKWKLAEVLLTLMSFAKVSECVEA